MGARFGTSLSKELPAWQNLCSVNSYLDLLFILKTMISSRRYQFGNPRSRSRSILNCLHPSFARSARKPLCRLATVPFRRTTRLLAKKKSAPKSEDAKLRVFRYFEDFLFFSASQAREEEEEVEVTASNKRSKQKTLPSRSKSDPSKCSEDVRSRLCRCFSFCDFL